jgi:hypothetical protein
MKVKAEFPSGDCSVPSSNDICNESITPKADLDEEENVEHGSSVDLLMRVRWLKAISAFDKFSLFIRFVSKPTVQDILDLFDAQSDIKVASARMKYSSML